MAQNWNVKQAMEAINNGQKENLQDIGRRFPLATVTLAKIDYNGAGIKTLFDAFPDYFTMRKLEQALKGEAQQDDEAETNDTPDATTEDAEEEAEAGGTEYDKMNRKQLRDLIRNAGGEKKCREEFGWAKREQMLAYIEKYGLEGTANDEDDAEEEEENTDPYEGKTAVELFKECKKRKIKVEPKKPAKEYADLLRKDDAKNAAAPEEEDDEDWGDEEEEDEKPKKPAKPQTQKPAKGQKATKPAPKKEEDDEDEDNWDI